MNILKILLFGALAVCSIAVIAQEAQPKRAPLQSPDDAAIASIRTSAGQLTEAFNAGKVDEMAAMFLPNGELIDEAGTVYQGQKEIKDLLKNL